MKLWSCTESNVREDTSALVVAETKKQALEKFRRMDRLRGWGTYSATEVTAIDGYKVVLVKEDTAL